MNSAKNISDADFAEAYAGVYGKATRHHGSNVGEMEFCPLCREHIKPGDETVQETCAQGLSRAAIRDGIVKLHIGDETFLRCT